MPGVYPSVRDDMLHPTSWPASLHSVLSMSSVSVPVRELRQAQPAPRHSTTSAFCPTPVARQRLARLLQVAGTSCRQRDRGASCKCLPRKWLKRQSKSQLGLWISLANYDRLLNGSSASRISSAVQKRSCGSRASAWSMMAASSCGRSGQTSANGTGVSSSTTVNAQRLPFRS